MKVQDRKGRFPMLLWAGFWMTLLLPLLFCLLSPNPVSASTVASGITTSTATTSTHQRKSFYANGRYWVFYSDATDMVYKTSLDGVSWSVRPRFERLTPGPGFLFFLTAPSPLCLLRRIQQYSDLLPSRHTELEWNHHLERRRTNSPRRRLRERLITAPALPWLPTEGPGSATRDTQRARTSIPTSLEI